MAALPQTPNLNLEKRPRTTAHEERGRPAQERDEQHQLARRVREVGQAPTTTR